MHLVQMKALVGTDRDGSIPQAIHVALAETATDSGEEDTSAGEGPVCVEGPRAGDRIRAICRGDSAPHRGQGGDRVCILGIKTNQQCAQSEKPIHFKS